MSSSAILQDDVLGLTDARSQNLSRGRRTILLRPPAAPTSTPNERDPTRIIDAACPLLCKHVCGASGFEHANVLVSRSLECGLLHSNKRRRASIWTTLLFQTYCFQTPCEFRKVHCEDRYSKEPTSGMDSWALPDGLMAPSLDS